MRSSKTLVVALTACTLLGCMSPSGGGNAVRPPLSSLLEVDDTNYTGGLGLKERALANSIVETLRPQFPYTACSQPDFRAGQLIGYADNMAADNSSSLAGLDPNLTFLIRALDDPRQKVRDLSAYTLGMLGPSARDAQAYLEKKWSDGSIKGGWYNDAVEKISCDRIVAGDFRRTIPDALLPPQVPWLDFLTAAAKLMATLYLNRDLEYPPGMMGYAYSNYAIADYAGSAAPLLARILEDTELSPEKHIEAVQALTAINPRFLAVALPGLLIHADSTNSTLRYQVGTALVRLHHERAVDLMIERIRASEWHWSWERELCELGPSAVSAEDALLEVALHSTWPSNACGAVTALGCIHSSKANPDLISMLRLPDWVLNERAAIALGKIDNRSPEVVSALSGVIARHWSARVRKAALEAIIGDRIQDTESAVISDEATKEIETVLIGGGPEPIDHGLAWCNERGRYSIDGNQWFNVRWTRPTLEPIPPGFRRTEVLQSVGTQRFLRVNGGWLVGSDGFEGQGILAYVSDSGEFHELDEGHGTIRGIVQIGGRFLAFGYEILKAGGEGALFELKQSPSGDWQSHRILALPSAPWAHAIAPSGELLLADEPNQYAIVGDEVVPLKCEIVRQENYFRSD